ncbi:MAG TPA: ComF family protein [Polyangia bacterium]|nr:ComF family protein [Polyangia bacterium]
MSLRAAGLLDALAGLLWPARCVACGCFLPPDGAGVPIRRAFCARCEESVVAWSEPGCPRCGEPFDSGPGHLCGACLADPPPFSGLGAALLYGGAGAEAVIRLKYSRSPWTALPLGWLMTRLVEPRLPLPDGPRVVVPTPLHPRRLRERGFNQSALLARELARALGFPLQAGLLGRVRETGSRKGLSRADRHADLEGAFAVGERKSLAGLSILLVDDVVTTGATVRAASRAILDGGASAVHVVCLARAPMGSVAAGLPAGRRIA